MHIFLGRKIVHDKKSSKYQGELRTVLAKYNLIFRVDVTLCSCYHFDYRFRQRVIVACAFGHDKFKRFGWQSQHPEGDILCLWFGDVEVLQQIGLDGVCNVVDHLVPHARPPSHGERLKVVRLEELLRLVVQEPVRLVGVGLVPKLLRHAHGVVVDEYYGILWYFKS